MHKGTFIVFVSCLLWMSGCGKKQKNIFVFNPTTFSYKTDRLSLPRVRGVQLERKADTTIITWHSLDQYFLQKLTSHYAQHASPLFLGYALFRFEHGYFMSSEWIHKDPIRENRFVDFTNLYKRPCYSVCAVFKIGKDIICGPKSNIKCL